MFLLAGNHDGIAAAAGQGIRQRTVRVQAFAALVQRDHFQGRADLHRAGIRATDSGQDVQQRCLARAIGADNADPVAAHYPRRERVNERRSVIGFADGLGFHHQLAGCRGFADGHFRHAGHLALIEAFLAEDLQSPQTALIAFSSSRHAMDNPVVFPHDLAVKFVPVQFFLRQGFIAPGLELRKAFVQAADDPAINPHRGPGQVFQKPPVMADQNKRRTQALQLAFKPFDGGQVQMVCRLVQQQDVRFRGQRTGEGASTCFAAGKTGRVLFPGQAKNVQQVRRAVTVIRGDEARFDILQCCAVPAHIRLLGQVPDGHAGLGKPLACVGFKQACGDFQEG